MNSFLHVYHLIFKIAEWLLALIAAVLVGAVTIAVFYRYVLNASVAWGDELPSLALVWLTFLGAAVLARHNENLTFDGVSAAMPRSVQRAFEVFNGILIIIFLAIMTYYGWRFTIQTWDRQVITLPITMGWVRMIVPICGILMIITYLLRILRAILDLPQDKPEDIH